MISGFCFTRLLVVSVHKSTVVTHSTSGGVFNFELKTLIKMAASRSVFFQLQKKKNLHVPAFIIFPYPVFGHTN